MKILILVLVSLITIFAFNKDKFCESIDDGALLKVSNVPATYINITCQNAEPIIESYACQCIYNGQSYTCGSIIYTPSEQQCCNGHWYVYHGAPCG